MGVSSLLSQILLFYFYSPSGERCVEAAASGDFVIGSDQNCLLLSRKHIGRIIELTLRVNSGQRERRWVTLRIVDNVRGNIAPHTLFFDIATGVCGCAAGDPPHVSSLLKPRFAGNRQVQVWTSLGRKR